ncbi:uncharacterized protein [Miscanthus floridulus]|uniref:uncharacterized protein n=1 Tax=Miscanthus floridulus TaxID=154761 RepID=UPI00345776C2
MDGGSDLNILYTNTLELLGLDQSWLRGDAAPFHDIVPGKRTRPLGGIDLPVCFGTPSNYRKEVLTFEVVGFKGTYHTILGRLCYAKFMAIPNYTYLKLKMPEYDDVLDIVHELLPPDSKPPDDFYQSRKVLEGLEKMFD